MTVSWVVFDAESVTHADSAGLAALGDLAKDLARDEITLAVAGLRTRMQEQLDLAGVTETIGREHFFPSVSAAVEAFQAETG